MRLAALLVAILTASPLSAVDQFTPPAEVREALYFYSAEQGIPIYIATGLLWSESGGHRYAVNKTSKGYWQLNAVWHDDFALRFNRGRQFDEFDPVASTRVALRYLGALHRRFGKWVAAIAYYKTGSVTPAGKFVALARKIVRGEIF